MSKKVLAALLAVCMVASLLFVPAAAASTFTDVDEDHWASGAIERWAGYGVLNGKDAEAGIFDPSAPMTRAEFAKMLVEMLGLTAKSEATFDDVDPEAWYADVVSIAVKAGIISGRPGNKFDPTASVTFEEAAVMMCRAFGLAQVTSGAEWAKESIEKLTSLGMIGEGADEHLQVGVDCDRAVVAALADAVVKEYVNEDREEPITGEVNGVVLVVKGAKVEIKDATVSAPIVVESAEVTLTGTKAEDVKVSGKDAAIVADEASTVASVTLAGEAPKADIKGEVASVTIAEETTGAVVDAPKADPDTIVNNSTEEATVNGETVEGKPAETTDPTEPEGPGSVSGNDGPEAPPRQPADKTEGSSGDKTDPTPVEPEDPKTPAEQQPGAADDGTTENEDTNICSSHTWSAKAVIDTPATCDAAGTAHYTCTTANCPATQKVTIPKLSHVLYAKEIKTQPTCKTTGVKVMACSNPGCTHTEEQDIPVVAHDFTTRTGFDSTQHYKLCKYCDEKQDATAHTLEYAQAGTKHTATCTGCDYTKSETHEAQGDYQKDETNHWKLCVCGAKVGETAHVYDQEGDKCVCGADKPATTEPDPEECQHAQTKLVKIDASTHKVVCANDECGEVIEDNVACTANGTAWSAESDGEYYQHCACGNKVGSACTHDTRDTEDNTKCATCGKTGLEAPTENPPRK